MHIPSFLVGSVVSGGAFLLVDRQLSHRHKLSTRWVLAENAEREFNIVWKGAMSSVKKTVRAEGTNAGDCGEWSELNTFRGNTILYRM